jgi:guanine nucleotide-binding protein subunit alpha
LRLIIETLKAEWEPSGGNAPSDTTGGPARKLRQLCLTLSPLFFIEANILKLISPGCKDCREVCVRGTEWKSLLSKRPRPPPPGSADLGLNARRRSQSAINHENDPTSVLCASRDEIIDLWEDPAVQETLERRGVYLSQMPGL